MLQTRIYLQRSAPIRPKTSEICRNFAKHWQLPYGSEPAAEGHPEDELLFGRAGYLYAVLYARAYTQGDADDVLRRVAERCVAKIFLIRS